MKLKTLRDVGTDSRFCSKLPMFARTELKDILKKEAIKWIKADIIAYKIANLNLPNGEQGRIIHNFIVQRRQFWKDRLNITEEDLQ